MKKDLLSILVKIFAVLAGLNIYFSLRIINDIFYANGVGLSNQKNMNDVYLNLFSVNYPVLGIALAIFILYGGFLLTGAKDLHIPLLRNLPLMHSMLVGFYHKSSRGVRITIIITGVVVIGGCLYYVCINWIAFLYLSLILALVFTPSIHRWKTEWIVFFIIFYCIHFFYGESLKRENIEVHSYYIFELDNRTIETSQENQLIYDGSKNYIFKNTTNGVIEYIPEREVRSIRQLPVKLVD